MEKHTTTLVDLLRRRAIVQSEEILYTFLNYQKEGVEEDHLTYGELDRKARLLAAHLRKLGTQGQRVLLIYPPGLDYIIAFFACLYAGAVAVPAYPPQFQRLDRQDRTLSKRFLAILKDARPLLALTTGDIANKVAQLQLAELSVLRWVSTDDLSLLEEEAWVAPDIAPDTLALLQYTSGSTSLPKGVMLTHANLLHNLAIIQHYFRHDETSRGVSWLPVYHDMGLIGGILQPLYVGFPVVLLSPLAFLQRPLRWLEAIAHYRATGSGGPNFAYDLCVRKSTPDERARLDLSSWRVAFNGAEPLRSTTLSTFATTFAESGFRPEAFLPCYGLAEATLMVSGNATPSFPRFLSLRSDALQRHEVALAASPEGATTLVSSGTPAVEQTILIVDTQTLVPCPDDRVGEIWIAGDSVASGYWEQDEQTRAVFRAYTADGQGPFLRTGDLGFLHEQELFVTGRLRDLIIIRGANYYPQDIEQILEEAHSGLRAGCTAAFSLEIDGEEKLAVACEVERTYRQSDFAQLTQSIRQTLAQEYALEIYKVVLLKAGSVPRTSSGKIQRSACRADLLAGRLPVLAESVLATHEEWTTREKDEQACVLTRQDLLALEVSQRRARVEQYLRACAASVIRVPAALLAFDQPLTAAGLDSLKAIELQYQIQADLECDLTLDRLFSGASISTLAAELLTLLARDTADTGVRSPQPMTDLTQSQPLSPGQRALWFLQQLVPTNPAYNIARAVRLCNTCDLASLEGAIRRLIQRHPALRTIFVPQDNGLKQSIQQTVTGVFRHEDAADWSEQQLKDRLAEEAHHTFDLAQGPLFQVWAFTRSAQDTILLFVGHHLILDFWSLTLLMHELGVLYQEINGGIKGALPELPLTYFDYVQWQHNLLLGKRGDVLWKYWQQQLGGELPVLNFPLDKPRPSVQTYSGACQTLYLPGTITEKLKELSLSQNVTLHTVLVAAFQVLLARYSGQEDFVLGSLTNGRTQNQFKDIVGYFVNPLVLRADLRGNPSFQDYLARVRETILAAFAHQDFPFATLVERLQPVRDPSRSPIFQVVFVWQNTPLQADLNLTPLALNAGGAVLRVGPLEMETVAVDQYTTQFDLILAMGESAGGLQASLQYNTDLFNQSTMSDLLARFATLLEGIVRDPATRLVELPVINPVDQERLLSALSGTRAEYARESCIHTLFEEQVARQPAATALVYQDESLSYEQLNSRANQLAWHLRRLGVGPEVRVGICLERSLELLVGLLAILKAGGTYVPLDPTYPRERLAYISADAAFPVVLTRRRHTSLFVDKIMLVCLDELNALLNDEKSSNLPREVCGANSAYAIYTSGSTGKPKGVVVEHRNVINFFAGMDERIGCSQADTILALTSISFDISVLELFWTLVNGARVILLGEKALFAASSPAEQGQQRVSTTKMDFSLFYFANEEARVTKDRYRLLLEGAKFADTHGFSAVWTPERHFHSFGGLYPNPSVTSAALATITEHVHLRAGSVVLPLHNPLRVAEEWSVVDNLSDGRVGLAFASGWHANDFVYFPQNYAERKKIMFEGIKAVQHLWEGNALSVKDGSGTEISVKISPPPLQSKLPIWITAAGSDETFIKAGEIGANVLTHLLGQSVEDVARKIALYRESLERSGFDRDAGQVTLMLHTFIGPDEKIVREKIRLPFTNYLRTSIGLIENLIKTLHLSLDLAAISTQDMDDLLAFAVDRYYETSALFGTPEKCAKLINTLKTIGVNEVACLIDFGIDTEDVLESLSYLNALREQASASVEQDEYTLASQALRYTPTLMQCTPSAMRMMSFDQQTMAALSTLRVLLLGGEALPSALVRDLREHLPVKVENMYGPTETTVWSATFPLQGSDVAETVPVGYPLINTQIYILDSHLHLVPPGVVGEIYIGGEGVSRGYSRQTGQTAERFIPDPFSSSGGQRLYRTGDLGRYQPDGLLEFLGRVDQQIKIRGFRIELEEIEAALSTHPEITEAVVIVPHSQTQDKQLIAYLVPGAHTPNQNELRAFLKTRLPDYMLPSAFVVLDQLPLTANGKIDRKALALLGGTKIRPMTDQVKPRNHIEQVIADIWSQALNREQVSMHDNFFDIGGHSLLIAQVHAQLRVALKQEFPLVKLLEHSTIDSLARYLQTLDNGQEALQQSVDRARLQREAQLRRLQRLRV